MKRIMLLTLILVAFSAFGWSVSRLVRFLLKGQPDRRFDRWPARIWGFFLYFIFQRKVPEPPAYGAGKRGITSVHHLFIFWGFLLITVGTTELLMNGVMPTWSFAFLGETVYGDLKLIIDWFNLLVLVAIAYAFFRRLVLKPRLIPMSRDAAAILSLIGLLMVTHFAYHALKFAAVGTEQWAMGPSVSGALASLLPQGTNVDLFLGIAESMWWLHIVTVLVFLNYIPYSKHIHLLGSLPNILFRNLDAKIAGTKRDLENENDYGVGKLEQFTWKQLLDGYACTECARCSNYCPAYNTDKPLSPMHIIHDMKDELRERGGLELALGLLGKPSPEGDAGTRAAPATTDDEHRALLRKRLEELPPLVGGRIKDDTLWSCTTCGACQEVCPVLIEHPRHIVDMRTHLVLSESRMPAELSRTFTNLERNSNPWGLGADRRMEWAAGLRVPTVEENPEFEYLLWVGCAAAFDDRAKKSMRALVQVLAHAKISFAVLGDAEQCCGDPARRGGNEYLFQMQAQANVETLNAAKVKKILTACPHGYHTLKNEYPQFGGSFEVIHHSELLAQLLEEKRLAPTVEVTKSVAYHDSCYLGRWNGIYDAPRRVLQAMPGAEAIELGRRRRHGFCCGGGGGRMFMEEKVGTRVNRNRTDEILASGTRVAAVACPFCTVMLEDGVKDAQAEERLQVLDVSEIVARSLPLDATQPSTGSSGSSPPEATTN